MATRLSLVALASALLAATVSAQSEGDDVRVWAVVAYVNHGEKTPNLGDLQEVLTPEGAQQMWRQGRAFRTRYFNATDGVNDSLRDAAGTAPIHEIETSALDNTQVDVASTEDEWAVGSALAFFQGLYPPASNIFNSLAGGDDLARNLAGNDSEEVEFPLEGYQYPKLQTLSSLDSESPSVQGAVGCTAWSAQTNQPLKQRDDMKKLEEETRDFYEGLFSAAPLEGAIVSDLADVWSAYELYEYVKYMYTHNQTVHDGLENANETLTELEKNALTIERAKNTEPDDEDNESIKELYTIAGRTLAMKIADQLERNLDWEGARDKLSVMFGSFEPLLAFLSVGDLLTRENLLSGPFTRFPEPGAALIVELIGDVSENSSTMPDAEDLRIRFYYRASANENEPFEGFSLFGSGYGGKSIPYTAFYRSMMEAGVSSEQWCSVCGSTNAPWCSDSDSSDDSSDDGSSSGILTSNSKLHPALAGLIGALVMGAVVTVVATALFALGGFRVRRVAPEERSSSTHGGGGFKGPEKKAPDADVTVSPVGAHQERVGSWELRDQGDTVGIVTRSREEARDGYDTDGISVIGASPVNARESV